MDEILTIHSFSSCSIIYTSLIVCESTQKNKQYERIRKVILFGYKAQLEKLILSLIVVCTHRNNNR